jgi:hypothetical protein
VKKSPIDENEEKLQKENPSKTSTGEVGRKTIKTLVYFLIAILVLAILYYITLQNNETFKILN